MLQSRLNKDPEMNLIGLEIGSSLFVYFWPFRGFFFQVQTQNCHRTSYLGPTDTFRGLLCKSVSMTSSGQGLLLYFFMLFLNLLADVKISDFHFLPTLHDLSTLNTKRANVWHIAACCTSPYCHSTTKEIF